MSVLTSLGTNFQFPSLITNQQNFLSYLLSGVTAQTFDVQGKKLGFFGFLKHATGGSGLTLSKIHFKAGPFTSPVMTLTAGMQGIDNTTGPGINADGTFTRSGTLDMSTATQNVWNSVTMGSGTATFSHGQEIAIVFDMASITSGSATIQGLNGPAHSAHRPQVNTHNATVWSSTSSSYSPLVVLEFNDGSFGTLMECPLGICTSSSNYNSGTGTADEYGISFQFPVQVKVNALFAIVSLANGSSNFELTLWDNVFSGTLTALLGPYTFDANTSGVADSTARHFVQIPFTETTLEANHTYGISLRPTSANNINHEEITLNSAAWRALLPAGTTLAKIQRLDQAANFSSSSTTVLPLITVGVSSVHDGATSGGGLLTHPGMAGGMNG